jgi:Zn-dependent oligopeptidase
MKYCSDSEVRREFFEARNSFAIATPHDNKKTILEILTLRQKKSKLLGFKNYAELSLHFKMADTPTQVMDLFSGIAEKSRQKANSEITEIQNFF